jgi:hypothetical protein
MDLTSHPPTPPSPAPAANDEICAECKRPISNGGGHQCSSPAVTR